MSAFSGRTYGRKTNSKSVRDASATFDDAVAKTTMLKWGTTVHTSFRSKTSDGATKRKGSPDTDDPFDFDIDNDDGPSKPKRGAGFKMSSDVSIFSAASSATSSTGLLPYKSSLTAMRSNVNKEKKVDSIDSGKTLSASSTVSTKNSKAPLSLADELGFDDDDIELKSDSRDKPKKKFFSSSRVSSSTHPNQNKVAGGKDLVSDTSIKPVKTATSKSAIHTMDNNTKKLTSTAATSIVKPVGGTATNNVAKAASSTSSVAMDTLLTVSTSSSLTTGASALVRKSPRKTTDYSSSSQVSNSSQNSSTLKNRNIFDDLDSDSADGGCTDSESQKQGAGDSIVRYVGASRQCAHDTPGGQVKRVEMDRPSVKPVKTAILTGHVVLKRTSGEAPSRKMAMGDTSTVNRKLLHKPSSYHQKAVYNPRIWQQSNDDDEEEADDDIEEVAVVTRKPSTDVIHANDVVLKRVTTWPPLHKPDLAIAKVKVKVARDTKPLFAVVHNVKKAHECQEYGETEDYDNDLEYIVDGLSASRSSAVRCLSAMNLATKCVQPAFRMHLRAKGSLAHIFSVLRDSAKDPTLALCTATVFYLLSRDRLAFDLDRQLLELLLSLLDCADVQDNKDTQQAKVKVSKLLEDLRAAGGRKMSGELESITTSELALETLLSLTSKKSGELFKDDLRVLGGLDHIVNSIVVSAATIDDSWSGGGSNTAMLKVHKITQCLRVLENVTYQNSANQNYLLLYKDATLVQSLLKCVQVSQAGLPSQRMQQEGGDKVNKNSTGYALYTLLLGALKVMVNLTHDCNSGCARLGQDRELVVRVLQCLMTLPQFIPFSERFDLSVLGLGLLINLAETSEPNRRLLVAVETDCPFMAGQVAARPRMGCLEALVMLFLAHLEAAHIVELEHDEELEAREQAMAQRRGNGSQLALEDGSGESSQVTHGYEMVRQQQSGAVVRRPRNDMSSTTSLNSDDDDTSTDLQVELMPGCQDDEETLARALHKAGRHMEDNIVAAYISLLTGALIQSNTTLIEQVRAQLPDKSFESMIRALRKFLGFMKFTMAGSSSGSESIKKIIDVLESC